MLTGAINRATTQQRTLGTNPNSDRKNRVSSVVKETRLEITPIEEIPARISKFKRSKQTQVKNNDKLQKAFDEAKDRGKRKVNKVIQLNKANPKNLLGTRRMGSNDKSGPCENKFPSPSKFSDIYKQVNHLEK
jgi:hypothetical protein